jgi:hypothetical protein
VRAAIAKRVFIQLLRGLEFLHQMELILSPSINFLFRLLQPVRHMRPRAHVQLFGNPLQRHRRLCPQPLGHAGFARIAFGALRQLCARPAKLVQFFVQDGV